MKNISAVKIVLSQKVFSLWMLEQDWKGFQLELVSLDGHFATLCQGFDFYAEEKILLFFKKEREILLPVVTIWQKVKVGRPVDHPIATSNSALEEGLRRPRKAFSMHATSQAGRYLSWFATCVALKVS